MNKVALILPLLLFSFACTQSQPSEGEEQAAGYNYDVEERLAELNIELGEPTPPVANYVKAVRTGNLVFLSGTARIDPTAGW